MKIYVVFTGGTIGSSVSGGVISPADSSKSVLLENYIALHGNDVSFETAAPYFALSENLCAENLNSLVRCVCGIAENGGEKNHCLPWHGYLAVFRRCAFLCPCGHKSLRRARERKLSSFRFTVKRLCQFRGSR